MIRFEKCIKCDRIGESCVPNLLTMSFADLIQWCNLRQKFLGWTNQKLAEMSGVPLSTINRIKAGDYMDCKYSTIKALLVALVGGTKDEFPCNEQVDKQLQQMDAIKQETETLKLRLNQIDEQHRSDIRAVREEYQQQIVDYKERIAFLKEELQAWRSVHQG